MASKHPYSDEPEDRQLFTERFDRFYSRFAHLYDWLVKALPIWRNWLNRVIPHLQGERILEASFGTGYLLTQYADRFKTYGIDYNATMAGIARKKLDERGIQANLQVADVGALPYADGVFDTIVNTMAFTGYPNAEPALSELRRVLKTGGLLVMIDINYPVGGNRMGTILTKAWQYSGDIIRDMNRLFSKFGFEHTDKEIGGFGSVHLYVATKVDITDVGVDS